MFKLGSCEKKVDILSQLPIELSNIVLSHMSATDLSVCLSVCRRWRVLANQEHLWRTHLDRLRTANECIDQVLPTSETAIDIDDDMILCKPASQWMSWKLRRKHLHRLMMPNVERERRSCPTWIIVVAIIHLLYGVVVLLYLSPGFLLKKNRLHKRQASWLFVL